MTVEIGQPAPPFELFDKTGEKLSLDNLKGRKSLIVFIPFPFTGMCEGELCTIRDRMAELNDFDANVVVITCDTRPANAKWSELNGFGFPVLSDFWPHGETVKRYGVFNEKVGSAIRATFVLDADGIVRDIVATDSLGTPREFDAYTEALARI
jgi:peroxiredoxin